MNRRKLDGGLEELASLIHRSLQNAFRDVGFQLESIGENGFCICWGYGVPGAPCENDVRESMARSWPDIHLKLVDSDKLSRADITSTATRIAATAGALANPSRRKRGKKTCLKCEQESKMSARACIYCGSLFPSCVVCNALIIPGARFCGKCGLQVPGPSRKTSPDLLPPATSLLYRAILPIEDEQSAREFFDREVALSPLQKAESVEILCRHLGECFKAGLSAERIAMWRRVIVAASVAAALRRT
jgi:hypothetical protein